MKWITRERPKIDRIACPWLVARFVDEAPEFLYEPGDEVMRVAHCSPLAGWQRPWSPAVGSRLPTTWPFGAAFGSTLSVMWLARWISGNHMR